MGLSGIEIFKKLPKTNCGKCGVPTCLAFAMKLATGKAELDACPDLSEDVKEELGEASAPPVRTVVIGTGERAVKLGGETVLFRHEKRFENPPAFTLLLSDKMDEAEISAKLTKFKDTTYERVGIVLQPAMVAVKGECKDTSGFMALVENVCNNTDAGLVLMNEDVDALSRAVKSCSNRKPLIYAATRKNAETLGNLAKELSCPLAVKGNSLEELAEISEKLIKMGLKDLVLDSGARTAGKSMEDQIIIRRSALMKKFKPFGFPTIVFPCEMTDNPMKEAMIACQMIVKYGSIIILSEMKGHSIFPLLLASMNIFTDPQRPMAVEQKIYEIGATDENSPVLITGNFSLTYFIVSGEVDASHVPSYLLIKDTEGLSVLTAWAAGKFGADTIAPFVKKCGIEEKVKHRKLVIPGYLATISGELEEELPDWQILIGPREASHLPAYLKQWNA
ncbi:MAG: acetyl-CoA decarbonylase/synthase complex subunit gamma [Desulfobacteraceae bacterium]|uniref:Acetyl-CoA decarbonylase/synthase complex subunit gamma n=1 Tax=Candidatus Desulfaltia bathyphila TaxID=2841697 RepID=A0A8J6TB99_9BACT|nr:acetyl-CoA decarbonylase/synthase complex subunit gamma [Candidatus Desulfaltia bathyphila]MBL7194691.1 acetyl-CoA decarbonylase/synthase complex subunit gamma [Desulfobacterales bacterium]